MSWFRTNIRAASLLALFALAVQFTLSFGHNHWPAARTSPTSVVAALSDAAVPAAGDRQLTTDQDPSKQDRDQQPADACAICAVVAMAQAMLLSPAPVLVLPQAVPFHREVAVVSTIQPAAIDLPFQARAPPLA
ncbi:DUF2946 family protein [Bradyrhizobium sp. HKCCYLS1011]|uniref:DUF2946 family protein n=1 Tax=Bradyrhizobium sp. HKCCYLS1011 TaxID=3420733 RepID=UPI003EC056F4